MLFTARDSENLNSIFTLDDVIFFSTKKFVIIFFYRYEHSFPYAKVRPFLPVGET